MADRPQRPVQHDIETASERAFLAAIPETWVAQKREGDYGVDLDVEIFQQGRATGIRFGVQLKGTRKKVSSPKTSIKVTTWNYWLDHDTPTLVVLWNDRHRHLWASWAHRFDTHGLDLSRAKFPYTFTDLDQWGPQTPAEIEGELAARRASRAPGDHLPIPVEINPAGALDGVRLGSLLASLRRRIKQAPDLLAVGASRDSVLVFRVNLTRDVSVIEIAGGTSFNLHHGEAHRPETEEEAAALAESIAADLMIGFGLHFRRLGLATEAARLVAPAVTQASLPWSLPFGGDLLTLLLEQSQLVEAKWLIETAARRLDPDPLNVMVIGVLAAGRAIGSSVRAEVAELLERLANEIAGEGRNEEGARLAYNASLIVSHDGLSRRLELLEAAAILDSSYRTRDYWLRELGGAHFLTGDFGLAALAYRQAADGGDVVSVPLLADALLSLGRYAEALDLFRDVAARGVDRDAEWRLKLRILEFLHHECPVDFQDRDRDAAEAVLKEGPTQARAALRKDMLLPGALWTLARAAEDAGLPESREWFLAMVVDDLYDAYSWVRVLVCDWSDDEETMADIGMCARRFCGEAVIELLLEMVDDPAEVRGVHRFFEGLPELESDDPRTIGLRVFGDDGSYSVDHAIEIR